VRKLSSGTTYPARHKRNNRLCIPLSLSSRTRHLLPRTHPTKPPTSATRDHTTQWNREISSKRPFAFQRKIVLSIGLLRPPASSKQNSYPNQPSSTPPESESQIMAAFRSLTHTARRTAPSVFHATRTYTTTAVRLSGKEDKLRTSRPHLILSSRGSRGIGEPGRAAFLKLQSLLYSCEEFNGG